MKQKETTKTNDNSCVIKNLSIEEQECLGLLKHISSSDKKAILKMLRGKIKSGTKD